MVSVLRSTGARIARAGMLIAPLSMAGLPFVAHAACFTMVDARNRPIYQATTTPIDLSGSISDTMARRYPGRFLVISPNADCASIGLVALRDGNAASLLPNTTGTGADYAGTSPAPESAQSAPPAFPDGTIDNGGLTLGRRGVLNLPQTGVAPGTPSSAGPANTAPAPTAPARVR